MSDRSREGDLPKCEWPACASLPPPGVFGGCEGFACEEGELDRLRAEVSRLREALRTIEGFTRPIIAIDESRGKKLRLIHETASRALSDSVAPREGEEP